jgi:hypothetical protein
LQGIWFNEIQPNSTIKEEKVKRILSVALAIALAIPFTFAVAFAGNGAPSGSHYNLNIIGQDTCKSGDMTGSNRHTIFVLLDYNDFTPTSPTPIASLDKRNKIFLQEGPFQVIDGNACDGAIFQLPKNECDTLTVEEVSGCDYDVYIRGLGSPKNNPYAEMTTCRIDTLGTPSTADDVYQCSTETITVSRNRGKSSFTNVTKQLTTLCLDTYVDLNYDGKCDLRATLFENEFYQYFWDYDNHGLRLAQLRFYPRVP